MGLAATDDTAIIADAVWRFSTNANRRKQMLRIKMMEGKQTKRKLTIA
jgi:hypothetical protein